jgi:hypothetical protein
MNANKISVVASTIDQILPPANDRLSEHVVDEISFATNEWVKLGYFFIAMTVSNPSPLWGPIKLRLIVVGRAWTMRSIVQKRRPGWG